jgi:hypothetical protein
MSIVVRGDFDEYVNASPVTILAGATHTYATEIVTKGADEITVQVWNGTLQENGSITGGASTSVDVYIYGNLGTGYATIPSGIMNLGTNSSDIMFVNTGSYKIQLKIYNGGVASTVVNYKVVVKR